MMLWLGKFSKVKRRGVFCVPLKSVRRGPFQGSQEAAQLQKNITLKNMNNKTKSSILAAAK